jgi:DNA-binding XRE family transcriptional regulator
MIMNNEIKGLRNEARYKQEGVLAGQKEDG